MITIISIATIASELGVGPKLSACLTCQELKNIQKNTIIIITIMTVHILIMVNIAIMVIIHSNSSSNGNRSVCKKLRP